MSNSRQWRHAGSALGIAAMTASGSFAVMATAPKHVLAHTKSTPVSITAELPPNSGPISSKQNADLKHFTLVYEHQHPGVTVNWIDNTFSSITPANAALVTRASGGADPDIVWEQYNPVNSGSIPQGIILNLTPYLRQKDPYDTQYPNWLATFKAADYPYMRNPAGQYDVILSSDVATGMFYNKADWKKAGIATPPTTWAQLLVDFKKLKSAKVTPFLFATGGINCNPSWWERKMSSSLLASAIKKIDVNHAQVLTGLDVATGVAKGTLTMKNPAYAEVWKLLGQLRPYLASGGVNYGACSTPTQTTPPLSAQSLLIKGQVATLWGGSWWGPQLDAQGFTGKWGVFPVPTVTKATTPFATGVNATGTVGGPNGVGQWSITTPKADSTMTPAKTKVVVNFLEYLTSPKVLSTWMVGEAGGPAYVPLVKGATLPKGASSLDTLLPKRKPPVTIEGLLDDVLTANGSDAGGRLLEEYVSGSISFNAFASQWDTIMKTAAQQWASLNHVKIPGLGA